VFTLVLRIAQTSPRRIADNDVKCLRAFGKIDVMV
jgi:hypothetical protein